MPVGPDEVLAEAARSYAVRGYVAAACMLPIVALLAWLAWRSFRTAPRTWTPVTGTVAEAACVPVTTFGTNTGYGLSYDCAVTVRHAVGGTTYVTRKAVRRPSPLAAGAVVPGVVDAQRPDAFEFEAAGSSLVAGLILAAMAAGFCAGAVLFVRAAARAS